MLFTSSNIVQALIRAVSSGDRDKVELFLREGADLNPSPSVVLFDFFV